MAISSLGVGSGLDLNSLVEGLLSAERLPVEQRLDKKEFKLQSELSAFGALSSAVSSLQTALNPLKDLTEGRTGVSSDSSIVSVSVDETSTVASYSVTADQLAQSHSLASGSYTNVTDVVGEGTLSFTIDGITTDITIDSSNSTLEGIRDAINAEDIDVNAVIVNDGSGYRLLLTSENSGLANEMEISITGDNDSNDTDNAGLSALSYTAGAMNMTQTVAAQDAQITVNGLTITSSTNSFEDSLPGVTLEVKETSTDPVSVDVALDIGKAKTAFNTFISAYNKLMEGLEQLSAFNAETGQASVLTGDSLVRGIKSNIRNELITGFGAEGSSIQSFVDLGIKTGADGKLSMDTEIFDAAIDGDFEGVIAFANAAGESLDSLTETYLGTDGTIKARQDSAQAGIEDIADQRIALEDRLARLESGLVKKYGALDTLLAGLQSTSNFISSQLATLDFSSSSKK
jgi:flagellar hook-associated protein 2